jgi:anti-sigma B factor antagonist
MKFDIQTERGIAVVAASGELDAATAPEFEAALGQAIGGGAKHVLIDLAGVSFIDSSGLATLVRALKRSRAGKGDLVLAGLRPAVRKVFDLTRLDKAFDIYSSRAEAVQRLAR